MTKIVWDVDKLRFFMAILVLYNDNMLLICFPLLVTTGVNGHVLKPCSI